MSCCSFFQSKDLVHRRSSPDHGVEQFLRHVGHARTLGEEARPCLTDRDRRFNLRGHRARDSYLLRGCRKHRQFFHVPCVVLNDNGRLQICCDFLQPLDRSYGQARGAVLWGRGPEPKDLPRLSWRPSTKRLAFPPWWHLARQSLSPPSSDQALPAHRDNKHSFP